MVLSSKLNSFSSKSVMSTDGENAVENIQGKNQFARFRILQTEVGEHIYVIYSLVMLTFRTEVICRYIYLLVAVTKR